MVMLQRTGSLTRHGGPFDRHRPDPNTFQSKLASDCALCRADTDSRPDEYKATVIKGS